MALTDKKYERIFSETGSDGDLITADEKALMKKEFDENTYIEDKDAVIRLGPVLWQLQKITEELDYLRTEISNNKDKTGISNSQASAIIANTAKTGITTQQATDISNNKTNISTNTTNIASKLRVSTLPTVPSGVEQEVECGVVFDSKAKTYSIVFAYLETSTVRGNKQTVTRTGSIQLK